MATHTQKDTSYRYVDIREAVAVQKAAFPALLAALRGVQNPQAVAIGDWTIRDVAAHLADMFVHYRGVALGEGSFYDHHSGIPGHNDLSIKKVTEPDVQVITDQIEAVAGPYFDAFDAADGDPLVPWAELKVPLSTIVGFGILEFLMHGYDIAHAEGRSFEVDPHAAALALKSISPVTEHYVIPEAAAGFTATYDIRLRGEWQMDFIFDDGKLSIEEPAGRKADVHISADPVAFALVGYGRVGQWGPSLKGQMVTWGRKPWLAFKFAKLLENP
jgi:uncharacterized protein (TIGR03083 family)